MNDKYYLKIGGNEVIGDAFVEELSSADGEIKKQAEAKLAEKLTETRVRVGTLLKTDNIGFLIGAGCSMAAGGVGLATIPLDLEIALLANAEGAGDGLRADWLTLFYLSCSLLTGRELAAAERNAALAVGGVAPERIKVNLEAYLSHLHMWRASMPEGVMGIELARDEDVNLPMTKAAVDKLIKNINRSLTALVNLPAAGKDAALNSHRRFLKKILTRPLNLRRANLFTLNYDTLLEQAGDGEGAVLVDGFVGTLKRIFRPECYDLDFYFPAQTTEGRVHRFDRALHLYKLHGSITWHRATPDWQNPYGLYATLYNQQEPEDDVMIYPSPLKYGQALGLPYSELFRRFGSAIAQPQSVLFAMGYGFGDDHVNALIRQALAIPSFTLVVVNPEARSDFVTKLIEVGDERVWLVAGSELGTFEHFVERLLPDLREEEITAKVMKTFRTLKPEQAQDAGADELPE
jgi:hypothetical protein